MNSKINIPKAFFSFLIASFFIWLLINLSKEYATIIKYQVNYKKLPQNKVFQKEPLKEIKLKIKASGFKLLSSNFYSKNIILYVDKLFYTSKGNYYILPKNQELMIQDQLYSGLKLENVLQDTISLQLGSLVSKRVPVVADVALDFEHGYDLASSLKVTPDSILISGPKLQLDKIDAVNTQKITLENLSESKEEQVMIKKPTSFNDIKMNHENVKVNIEVDKFTEGEFLIPFIIENLPYGTKINTFPKKVKVIFKVGLNNFNKITPSSFKVVCDYRVSKENDLPYLIPKLDLKSSLTSSVRLSPTKIEFLTQK